MEITECKAYEVLQHQMIEDIHAEGYLLRHKKSGARVMLLKNDDENKVFKLLSGRRRRTAPVWLIFWSTASCADPGIFR